MRDPNLAMPAFAEDRETPEALADLTILVIGNNGCWGRADTLEEAFANASRPKAYIAYICHKSVRVSEFDGSLTWNRGFAPRVISRKGTKKKHA